jgi:hypothetical protein
MKVRYISVSVFAVVAVAVLVVLSGSGNVIIDNAYAKYAPDTQTQANSNDCDNGSTCSITNPLIQGEGSTNAATNTQNPELNEEGEGNLGSSEQSTGGGIGTPPILAACEACFSPGGEFIFQSNLQEQAFFDAFNEECRCGFRPGVGINTIDELCSFLSVLGDLGRPADQRQVIGHIFDALRATPGLESGTPTEVMECLLNAFNIPT